VLPSGVGFIVVVEPPAELSSFDHAAIMHATRAKAKPPLILLRNSFLSRYFFKITG
jgi:hypothetical protein